MSDVSIYWYSTGVDTMDFVCDTVMENGLPCVLWTVWENGWAIFYVEGWFVAWQCH